MKRLFKWICRLVGKLFSKEKLYGYQIVEDMPEKLNDDIIYIFDHMGFHWQLVMICPCGCKTPLHLNLNKDDKPCWTYSVDASKKISISPSLHRKSGCNSHFFVRKSKIDWC
jgi:hypothetical protein